MLVTVRTRSTSVSGSSRTVIDILSRATIFVMGMISLLAGLWAMATIAVAFGNSGAAEMLSGFISAMTGV